MHLWYVKSFNDFIRGIVVKPEQEFHHPLIHSVLGGIGNGKARPEIAFLGMLLKTKRQKTKSFAKRQSIEAVIVPFVLHFFHSFFLTLHGYPLNITLYGPSM